MDLIGFALRNIRANALRSWIIGLCAFLVAGLSIGAVMFLRGADSSLRLANERLGADIVVVPEGTLGKVEEALLMAHTTRVWMPAENLARIGSVPGVQAASPQIYLSTLSNASCCSVSDMFLIVFDPTTDFALQPWLVSTIGQGLKLGEVVGGDYVFTPEGQENISIYGFLVTLKANLAETGTGIDQSMFMTLETAREIARMSTTLAEQPLEIPENSISAAMVRLAPGADPAKTADEIRRAVPGVTTVVSANLFQTQRRQFGALRVVLLTILVLTVILSLVLIGLVYSLAANARRRELGVVRAMGGDSAFVFRTLLAEASILAAAGALSGIALAVAVLYLFRNFIVNSTGLPLLLPSPGLLLLQALIGVGLALAVVTVAALLPALRISRLDPAIAMRE